MVNTPVLDKDIQRVLASIARGKKLRFPYETSTSEPYRKTLEARFAEFTRKIEKLDPEKSVFHAEIRSKLDEVKNLNDSLLKVVDQYLIGNIGDASNEIKCILQSELVKVHLSKLTFDLGRPPKKPKNLYRIRVSETRLVDQRDMFHIPYESRHNISTQRYSISGLPSLYLGESIYACWEEMGRPNLNHVYLSRFEAIPQGRFGVKYLNLAYSLELLLKEGDPLQLDDDFGDPILYQAFIFLYPIVIACSFKRLHDSSKFNVEYVIPNLLLQEVQKNTYQFNGIAYLSTKSKQIRDSRLGISYVFPPRPYKVEERGYCAYLSELFRFTKPVSWQVLDSIDQTDVESDFTLNAGVDLEENLLRNYKFTRFYRFEMKLESFEAEKLLK